VITDLRESIFLGEQQFGLFEGSDWTNGELDEEHPKEIVYYRVKENSKKILIVRKRRSLEAVFGLKFPWERADSMFV
jgi:hypothetical protein